MTLTRSNPRARPRWLVLAFVVATMTLLVAGAVFAVHDEDFQLDGDVVAAGGPAAQPVDWSSLFDANGDELTLPTGFTASGFQKDFLNSGSTFITSDATTFATGSKDTLPISGWQCNKDNNVNSKIDVMNAYAASYRNADGDEIIYFALERNTNTGDANVGFWFLQDAVACDASAGTQTFSGEHRDGDLLIVSAFSNGGTVSTINVYRWNGGANGSLGTTPVASGVDCRAPTTPGGDPACAAANTTANGVNGTITTPWLTANFKDKVGNQLRTAEFFEGGVNLTDSNLGGKCFNVFIGDTRSSTSLTATLFDFARGVVGECTSSITTTPKQADGTTNIPAAGLSIGANARVDVRDSAALTVTGVSTYGGDVTFSLCGPLAASSTSNCQTGGVQIGSPVAVAGTSPETVLSPTATLTSAGRYCWRAEYSGDATKGVPASSDPTNATNVSECFLITPLQPTLSTQATVGPVDFGQSISDSVTIGNTAKQPGTDGIGPGGTINATAATQVAANNLVRVTAYGPDSCTTVALAEVTLTVNGNGTYGGAGSATEFTPSAPGEYVFVASYDGDDPNTLGVAAIACASQPSNERVVVRQIPTEIKTKQSWIPNDTATISATSGNLAAGGTVVFSLYDNATCTGTAKYTESVTLAGGAATEEVGTSNTGSGATGFKITTGYADSADTTVTYSWKVVYTPAASDTAHTGIQSACDVEHFSVKYTNDNGPGTDLP